MTPRSGDLAVACANAGRGYSPRNCHVRETDLGDHRRETSENPQVIQDQHVTGSPGDAETG
jgi:hypothetical protein